MPDEAVMDAAVEAPLETTTEVEESAGQESTGLETPETQEAPPEGQITAPEVKLIDGGKLSADAKATLEKLKAENPALAKAFQRALFKEAEFSRALPGGIKELNSLRETVETLGGENGIQEMQAEVNGFRQFDQQYTQADPKAIEFMTSDPQGQEAFVKLMPSALQKFEALHPEGYKNYIAQVMDSSLAASGIPLALDRLADFLGDNPKAMEQWNKLASFVRFIGDTARKAPEAPKFAANQPDNRMGELEQREATLTRNEWKAATAGEQQQVYSSEWARLAGNRQVSATQKAAIEELFESRLNRAIAKEHSPKLDRYFAAKDRDGFMRYASNLNKTEVPKALREAFDAIMPQRPGPKAGTAPAPARNGAPAKGIPIAQGFTQIAKQPATAEIDYRNSFNTPANFQAGKAILVGGKRVQWQKA